MSSNQSNVRRIIRVWDRYGIHAERKLLLEINIFGTKNSIGRKISADLQKKYINRYKKIKNENHKFAFAHHYEKAYKIITGN